MEPTITIGVCARNSEKFISNTIQSILNQEFPHDLMEIIFVDDGSTDKTSEVLKKKLLQINIFTKIFYQEWKGLGFTRNVVVDNARGNYILWVDADTLLSKDYVQKQVSFMEKNKNVGICYGHTALPFDNKPILTLQLLPMSIEIAEQTNNRFNQGEWKKLPATAGSTYRTEAIRQVGKFDENITGTGEDIDAARRIQNAGWLIRQSGGTVYETHNYMSTWKDLWDMYVRHGFASVYLFKQNKKQFSLPRMTPLAGLVAGFLYSIKAYKRFHRKIVFLLPIHFIFKLNAWWVGFIKKLVM